MGKIHVGVIAWDQKLGGVLEACHPSLTLTAKTTMNIYNMHRIRQTGPSFGSLRLKLDNGESYNVATFFTGYGGSTSPDGFTANYGSEFGISERIICLFLPMELNTNDYESILSKISSRIILDPDSIEDSTVKIADIINTSGVANNPDELLKFLDKYLDSKLRLSPEQISDGNFYDVKAHRILLTDKKEIIKDLRINPASAAACIDEEKIADAERKNKEVAELINKIQQISMEKAMTEAITTQQQETIETLKADYVKIFGTLTEQIMMLENELGAIKESTQALVQDLNRALREKIQRINELEQELAELKRERQ